ncbi:ribonucleotide-diphosphate reductase subunit beta [uncultured Flavobacterium sp.]|uniref:ribonucleotide-diphosphate reductase subunit beta n=1 Tax=uncultured Flavobacterium sp. TaxID=165435 RepID=UPI0025932671|nr:ribonucleotide-diphosphate reductase subunit beta [uncultured Flavobacterium sp.]
MNILFNKDNTEWMTGENQLILGQAPGLFDSINVPHPELHNLYKLQKSIDWSEDELTHEQSRIDMLTCPPKIKELMLLNLSYQWETDSIAARSVAPLFAPFITNSQFWSAILKNSEMEVTHSLTYSEIIRQCIADPKEVFRLVVNNAFIEERLSPALRYLTELSNAGAKYSLGLIKNDQELFNIVFLSMVVMLCLEGIQFGSSFATTFGIVELGLFLSIGQLVQKIMIDELACHAQTWKTAIGILLKTSRGKLAMEMVGNEIKSIIDIFVGAEFAWNKYQFSENRTIVGLNEQLCNDWSEYNAAPIYNLFGFHKNIYDIPLPYMFKWLDMNSFQHAQQESSSSNYALSSVVYDIGDDEILEYNYA